MCIINNGFTKECVILTKPSTSLDLNGFINYGQIFQFKIKTYWCEGSRSVTSAQKIEIKTGKLFDWRFEFISYIFQ